MEEVKYIPGDLVIHYGVKSIVDIVSCSQKRNEVCYGLHHLDGNDTSYQSFKRGQLIPINLTPAILEANGWKRDGGQYILSFTSRGGDKTELIGFFIDMPKDVHDKLKHKYFQITHDYKVIYGCFYVHQLQHFLFGLGLNSRLKV